MTWGAVAIGVGTTVAGVYSANKAADASERGADQASQVQMDMYSQSRKDLEPWRKTGASALQKLAALNGVDYNGPGSSQPDYSGENFDAQKYLADNPDVAAAYVDPWWHWQNAGQFENRTFPMINQPAAAGANSANSGAPDYSAFYDSPDYKFTFAEGQRAVNSGLAARGLSGSGRALKELTRYGQGAASTQLNNYRNQLAALAGVGQTATTNTAQLGANTATNVGQSYQNAADARASGYLGVGNAVSNGVSQGYGMYALNKLLNKQAA
jgi:hypothetical protein